MTDRLQNIAQAQAEIDRLETEATTAEAKAGSSTETARKPAANKQQVNGSASAGAEHKQEDDAVNDVADDLQKTKIEDDAAPEASA